MSEAKHTPGPWSLDGTTVIAERMPRVTYGKKNEFDRAYIVCQPSLYSDPEWGGEEKRANAKLIAAAPELLELVELVHKSFGGGCVMAFSDADIQRFAEVYEKATGGAA